MINMFAAMYEILFDTFKGKAMRSTTKLKFEIAQIAENDIHDLIIKMSDINENTDTIDDSVSIKLLKYISVELINKLFEMLPYYLSGILENAPTKNVYNYASINSVNNNKRGVKNIRKNQLIPSPIGKDPDTARIIHKINQLQCLFTWNIIPKNVILCIWKKYGEYNLNISSPEFKLERFIGNIIISYELFHAGEAELAFWKVLEIGKWLDELDKGTDEFYLSIKNGLQHIMKANFIHMLYAKNHTEPTIWVSDDTKAFALMDSKSRASVHAIHAAVLIEYGENQFYFKKACDMAEKACNLDPKTSHWFYIHSLALTAQRKFSQTHKSIPANTEIKAIHQAILLSNGNNPSINYHKLSIAKDIALGNYYDLDLNNEKNKTIIKRNLQENLKLVDMVKTLINMDPRDPLLVVGCAKILIALPDMVQDFNWVKKYLDKALEMSQDIIVLKAIGETVEAYYNEISKRKDPETTGIVQKQPCSKNVKSQLETDLEFLMKIINNDEEPFFHLLSKYD